MTYIHPDEATVRTLVDRFATRRFADQHDDFRSAAIDHLFADRVDATARHGTNTCARYRMRFFDFHANWWEAYFHSSAVEGRLRRKLESTFKSRGLEQDVYQFVAERIANKRFRRLRRYRGQASRAGYTHTVIGNLIRDFSRHREGRKRVPKAVERAGPRMERLFHLLCMERRSDTETIEIVRAEDPERKLTDVRIRVEMTELRRLVPDCGAYSSRDVLDRAVSYNESAHWTEDVDEPRAERVRSRHQAVSMLLGEEPPLVDAEQLVRDLQELELTDEERLLLSDEFVQGRSIAAMARDRRISDYRVRQMRTMLLTRLKLVLEHHGLSVDSFDRDAR